MDLFETNPPEPTVHPGRKLSGRLADLRVGDRPGFETRALEAVDLMHEGMAGDGHAGFTREAGGREPWYPRGTVIRSGRQLSVLSVEELAEVGERLGIGAVGAGVVGANLVIEGVPRLSFLPAGTRMFFEGGATVVVEAQNAPCRYAGDALAAAHPDREGLSAAYVKAAARRRGLVASVERPGRVTAGMAVSLKLPEQWIYG